MTFWSGSPPTDVEPDFRVVAVSVAFHWDCNRRVIFKHYFCVTGIDGPSSAGGGRPCCSTCVLTLWFITVNEPVRNAHLNKETWTEKKRNILGHLLVQLYSCFFWFYNTYINIIAHKTSTPVMINVRDRYLDICSWVCAGICLDLFFYVFFSPPSSRRLLMYLIYDTPAVCVCVCASNCVVRFPTLLLMKKCCSSSESPDDLPVTPRSTQWGGEDPTRQRGQELRASAPSFSIGVKSSKMKMDRSYPKCCHNTITGSVYPSIIPFLSNEGSLLLKWRRAHQKNTRRFAHSCLPHHNLH